MELGLLSFISTAVQTTTVRQEGKSFFFFSLSLLSDDVSLSLSLCLASAHMCVDVCALYKLRMYIKYVLRLTLEMNRK